jgi:hypothetical protein
VSSRLWMFAAAAALAGCGDPVPEVEILDVTPAVIDPGADDANDVQVRVSYVDDDGDLGGGVAEISDCRAVGLVTEVTLPSIANEEAVADGASIDGELVLAVTDVLAVDDAPGDGCAAFGAAAPAAGQTSFCVVLVDAAGNRSDADCSQPVALTASGN